MTRHARCRCLSGLVVALVAGVAAAGGARTADDSREWEETTTLSPVFEDPTAEPELVVDSLWGGIRVVGTDEGMVEVVVHHVVRAASDAAVERARREVTLETARAGGRIELVVDGPFRDREGGGERRWNGWDPDFEVVYDFEIRVPRRTHLDLRTVLDGDVEVEGMNGRLQLSNVVGDVLVRAASPPGGSLETVSGAVRAELVKAPRDGMRFESVSGDIEVELPADLDADARLESRWGELSSDFEVELLPVRPVVRETEGGWSLEEATPAVRIGRGGPLLSFATLSGNIYLKKAGR